MCLWKFRIDIPGDPPDITIVTSVLARYPARLLNMSMDTGCHSATGEFVVDLPHGEGVGPILSALHDISPTVLIGREKSCVSSGPGRSGTAKTSAVAWIGPSGDRHASGGLRRVSRKRHAERRA
jgi:hypothetical protein